ncbi:glycosyltransferase 87 family protein [Streptomyces sp. CC228A]|uniref:glycosyltransferase 87 family protein n=1 Tax=Streptomyces sp. CC228A TaxID=2898186 RepID=UPI0035A8EF8F
MWLLTRCGMLWLLAHDTLGIGGVGREVHVLYRYWYEQLARGVLPADETAWQYPPGAALVLLAPGAVPGLTYFQAFVALTLAADAAVALALARARGGDCAAGAWYWTCALPLLLHLPLARYDVLVTALAVGGLLAVRAGPARLGGALVGLGALVKGWPLLALAGTPRGRVTRRSWGRWWPPRRPVRRRCSCCTRRPWGSSGTRAGAGCRWSRWAARCCPSPGWRAGRGRWCTGTGRSSSPARTRPSWRARPWC